MGGERGWVGGRVGGTCLGDVGLGKIVVIGSGGGVEGVCMGWVGGWVGWVEEEETWVGGWVGWRRRRFG